MSVKRSGLGRNLSALLSPSVASNTMLNPTILPVLQLQPGKFQPRREMNDLSLQELANSIKKQGLLQPIIVREVGSSNPVCYEIIAGERRWRASQLAELSDVPVVIHQVDDETAFAMALVENLQREDLNPMDQARAMQRLIQEFDFTHEQIASLLSKSRTAVSNYLRLLNLAPQVAVWLESGALEMGHARALLSLPANKQEAFARLVIEKQYSVRQIEALVAREKEASTAEVVQSRSKRFSEHYYREIALIAKLWSAPIQLKQSKQNAGKIEIFFKDEKQLEHLMEYMRAVNGETIS